jgi:hypothetical protein
MPTNFSLTQTEIQALTDLGINPNSNNLKQEIIQKLAELETKNSPLEGWQPQVDGVDANSQIISTSPSFQSGTPQRGELQHLTLNSPIEKSVEAGFIRQKTTWQKLPIDQFNTDFRSTKWGKNRFADNLSFFAPMKEAEAMIEYGQFWGLTEIFEVYNSGIKTERDFTTEGDFAICNQKEKLLQILKDFKSLNINDLREKYKIKDNRDWKLADIYDSFAKRENLENYIKPISYRPFDTRYTDYVLENEPCLGTYLRKETMQHLIKGENLGLTFARNYYGQQDYDFVFVSKNIIDIHLIGGQAYFAPLYLYQEEKQDESAEALDGLQNSFVKIPNFKKEFVEFINGKFGKVSPEAILGFIYASMHSPSYRTKYLELLKIDFPRVNFEVSEDQFEKLAEIGQDLIDAHLLKKNPQTENKIDLYAPDFDNVVVEKVRYDEALQRVYLAETTMSKPSVEATTVSPNSTVETITDRQNSPVEAGFIRQNIQNGKQELSSTYFEIISPAVWNYKIGGYQVLDKYLKARKDRVLSHQEIQHIKDTVKVIQWTLEVVQNKLK